MSSGCLSTVVNSTRCSLLGQVGMTITNYRFSPETVRVVIETPVLKRDVFDKTFDVPAATKESDKASDESPTVDGAGHKFYPETVYEPDVASSLHSYEVTLHYGEEKTFTSTWENTCDRLDIRIRGSDGPTVGVSTASPDYNP